MIQLTGKRQVINNALEENTVLSKLAELNVEWLDGEQISEFTPSIHGTTFKGFPYTLIVDSDGDLTWADGVTPKAGESSV